MSEHEVVYVQMDIVTLYTIINGQKTLEKTSSCNSEHQTSGMLLTQISWKYCFSCSKEHALNIWNVVNTLNVLKISLPAARNMH